MSNQKKIGAFTAELRELLQKWRKTSPGSQLESALELLIAYKIDHYFSKEEIELLQAAHPMEEEKSSPLRSPIRELSWLLKIFREGPLP